MEKRLFFSFASDLCIHSTGRLFDTCTCSLSLCIWISAIITFPHHCSSQRSLYITLYTNMKFHVKGDNSTKCTLSLQMLVMHYLHVWVWVCGRRRYDYKIQLLIETPPITKYVELSSVRDEDKTRIDSKRNEHEDIRG